jgi:hypothetical protein
MQCKNHPDQNAVYNCVSCKAPLCGECVEELKPGVYACFQCAMLQSVSAVGSNLVEKHEKAVEREVKKKKKWGLFQYFLLISLVLIVGMWGLIIVGGQRAPRSSAEFAKRGRVLLFMVDGALRRYAHYEGNKYPERLSDLVPKYLFLKEPELFHLKRLSYKLGPDIGYRLSLVHAKKGEMNPILSPGGITYAPPLIGGSK